MQTGEQTISFADPPFACPPDTVLYLPPPPSVNKTRRVDHAYMRHHHRWIEQADLHILESGGMRKLAKMPDRFEATIVIDENLNNLDLDNAAKAVIDYARRIGLIINDDKKHMRRVTIEWGHAPHGCRLILRPVA
jgi:Holliday junction resolvase RusA-like endonuclease